MPMERDPTTGGSVGQLSTGGGSLGGGGMHHSHSTPAGVDGGGARTPPTTPKKGGKMLAVRVQMLDDTVTMFQVQAKALGRVLFEQVCKQLHLLEADYFGLEYQDMSGTRYWLDLQKPVSRQLGLSLVDPLLHFCVKFYTPDPAQLEEEFTRYLFCLQVKRDLAHGLLQCNDNTAALMASYIVQAECGDYVVEDYPDHTYLSSYKFVPHQDQELERRIMENHKKHAGQSPAEADLNLLETARRCELYGMKMHPAKDHEGVPLNLAVAHMGLVVFQNFTKINTFSWAKIRKISFKRKRFLIKLHPEGYGYYKDTVEFFFEGRNECKNFWKKCVENHGFFRCSSVKHVPRHKTRVLSRGSSFRYSGKTQKQIVEFVRDNYVKRQTFQRSASFRHSSAHSSAANVHASLVGNSISAHPLLPLADNSLVNAGPAGSNLSTSLGSMGPASGRAAPALVSPTTRAAYRPPDTATCWSTVPSSTVAAGTRTTTAAGAEAPDSRTMSSPSPPLTTQSASPATSAATSPQRTITPRPQPLPPQRTTTHSSSPVAVRAAVHRADTGQPSTRHTTPTTPLIPLTPHTPPYTTPHMPPPPHSTTPFTRNTHTHTHSTTTRTLCNEHLLQKSEGSLDKAKYTSTYTPPGPGQTQSQLELGTQAQDSDPDTDQRSSPDEYTHTYPAAPSYRSEATALPKRQIWQRSASCRDLYDFSFEDSGKAKRRPKPTPPRAPQKNSYINMEERKLESPITRYDESNRALYSASSSRNVSLDIHQDIIVPGQKVYSSSYPGTTSLSQESMEDPGNYELAESQDDLSHDSYELLERSDDDYSTSGEYRHKKTKIVNTRSCSLDSGNYLPTDSESDSEKHHKYKSSSDVHQDIFMMDDPRDFPREKIPRKSDGTFYKTFKVSSRTSSLESKSDYYDTRTSKTSLRKSGWDQSFGSRTSSQDSKSDYENKKPTTTRKNKSFESLGMKPEYIESRTSSLDSKSDYFDATSKIIEEPKFNKYHHEFDRKIQFERNYGTQKQGKGVVNYDSFPSFKETSHVHSISLQNVETEQNIRANRMFSNLEQQNTVPRTHKSASSYSRSQKSYEPETRRSQTTTHIWPENIAGVPTEIEDWTTKARMQRSTESESNIFSFDEDKIQSLQESDIELGMCVDHSSYSIVSAMNQSNVTENDFKPKTSRNNYRDVFMEIDPKRLEMGRGDQLPLHQPIERTKSDPNSIANRQRLGSNARRHMLMHQKSIDLTPAESSDEDYLFKQIPSAPPLTKYRGTHFEMPTAEFGHFDILKREIEGQKTKFEVPKSQFEVLGAKTQSDLVNLPPKNDFDIPYVLHKRHMMNGTASKVEEIVKHKEPEKVVVDSPIITADKKWKSIPEPIVTDSSDECKSSVKTLPSDAEPTSSFLFTQNIDLSKIDPVTLEVDKSELPVQHMASPKRDITKIDPVMLEALSSKLSQIESDSPTSSKTESLKPEMKIRIQQLVEAEQKIDESKAVSDIKQKIINEKVDLKTKQNLKEKIKTELKPKRIIKPRMQPNKKGGKNKTKVRITSFSSDDESLDSDDVFGSAEATPTRLEFSPPQSRKEMEPILKYESERQHLQYTMSSTEIEGSPPTTRKQEYLPYDRSLDPNYQTELRRISERSISIPSSEDDVNYKNADLNRPVFEEPEDEKTLTILTEQINEECPTITEDSRDLRLTSDTISTLSVSEDLTRIEVIKPIPQEPKETEQKLSPAKPTISEKESPAALRKKGQSPLLFAHARLNLSEGSAFAVIQRQTATTSPTANRRAKSLDAPIISVNKLPPLNAFSSKDDTVEESAEIEENFEAQCEKVENKEKTTPVEQAKKESSEEEKPAEIEKQEIVKPEIEVKEPIKKEIEKKPAVKESSEKKDTPIKEVEKKEEKPKSKRPELKSKKSEEKDQIVPDVTARAKKPLTRSGSIQKGLPSQKSLPVDSNTTKSKTIPSQRSLPTQKSSRESRSTTTRDKTAPVKSLPPKKPAPSKPSEKSATPPIKPTSFKEKLPSQRSLPLKTEKENSKSLPSQKSLPTPQSLQPPEIKRTKSQEIESNKNNKPKEKSKSFEKLEFKRNGSKERAKSQEDSDSDVAKRIEKQQMLYETAIKQTLKSPVKDVLPVFPTVEETVRVNDGKLEISIDTIDTGNIPLEEAIIITKSPKRLDKKLTKSLELNLTVDKTDTDGDENGKSVQRLGKSLDLETRGDDDKVEFDFKPEALKAIEDKKPTDESLLAPIISETSPESDEHVVEQVIEAEVHKEPAVTDSEIKENIVLEGTSLDIWLSVDGRPEAAKEEGKMEKITVIQKSDENIFFEDTSISKPPDLVKEAIKHETKSSSESHSLEKMSLGNSLDIKYIDDSGDSSHKSEKDAKLIAELQKSIAIDNALSKKIEKIIRDGDKELKEDPKEMKTETPKETDDSMPDNTLVRITSEDESLTEVSDLKFETADSHLLGFDEHRSKGALLKLSIERSRSEDTTSWVTVECDEYLGADSFDVEEAPLESPEKVTSTETEAAERTTETSDTLTPEKAAAKPEDTQELKPTLLTTETKSSKIALLKHSSDHSRSSDTTGSWTSGEKDLSPGNNVRETGDESSVSCSIAKAIGLSTHIEQFESLEQLAAKNEDQPIVEKHHKPHLLERSSPIDEESSSASNGFTKHKEDTKGSKSDDSLEVSGAAKYSKNKYPFEQKWASDSELSQRIHKKISKKLSSAEKNSLSSLDDSVSDKRWNGKGSIEKPTLQSIDKLSLESRNSVDTESSSGSLGVAARLQKTGDLPAREPSSTWRPFLIESSGSSSLEEGLLPPDHDLDTQDYFLSRQSTGEYSGHYDLVTGKTEGDSQKDDDHYDFQDELAEFPSTFGYPSLTAAIGSIGIGSSDVLGSYGGGFLARTLSRISERSTNSENTSLEDDSTKASTQSDSVNDESLMSSDHQASLSSDPPSNPQPAAEAEKKSSNGSSGKKHKDSSGNSKPSNEQNIVHVNQLLLNRQMSDDRRTSAEMADLSIDDIEIITSERGLKLKRQDSDDTIIDEENFEEVNQLKPSSSQESEDWPLPDIPTQIEKHPRDKLRQLEFLHDMPSIDSAEQHAKLREITPPHIPKIFGQRGSLKSQDSEQWPSPPSSLFETPVVGNVESYYMEPEEVYKVTIDSTTDPTGENESNADSSEENKTLGNDDYCEVANEEDQIEECYSNSREEDQSGQEKSSSNSESVSGIQSRVKIVLEKKPTETHSSNSEEDMNVTLNDDVFTDVLVDTSKNELRPPTVLRRSTTSDDSSHSGAKNELKPPSPRHSHSSYSEEECTSSMGTNFEEGTVRFALRPTKCTHSSHSEDTSVALSLSEWSNSTNTVKFQNLSTSNNSCTNKSSTNTSGAMKSDDNSITDIAHSISEWSSSNSTTLMAQQSSSLQFQKLSTNTSTGDSTLTEMVPTISEWSSSDTVVNTSVPQTHNINTINIEGCLEQLLDDDESSSQGIPPKSPENIPSEDLVSIQLKMQSKEEMKQYTKSTERPVTIPLHHIMSDTEKSTESSSVERQVPPLVAEAAEKRSLRHYPSSKSTERPVKVPLKYSKCTPYYSSSLSSESTSAAVSKPIPITKTPTLPLTRAHRKSISKSLLQSPPSENDSTSSVESPIGTPETRVRGHRRRRQLQPKRHKHEREQRTSSKEEYVDQSPPLEYVEPEKFMCGKDFSDLPSDYEYKSDIIRRIYSENVEEGYFPDGDSQSGSDIFRIENDGDFDESLGRFEGLSLDGSLGETFDVSSIPPPLLEDDFEDPDREPEI